MVTYPAAVYSALNVLSLYHDSVLHRSLSSLPPAARPTPSSHARYTLHYTLTSPSYALLSRALALLSYSELLIEMGIQKRLGHEKAEQVVLGIECLKAALRLALMKVTGGRTSVQPPVPEREVDPGKVLEKYSLPRVVEGEPPNARIVVAEEMGDNGNGIRRDGEFRDHPDFWKGSRTGHSHPTLASLRPPTLDMPLLGDATAMGGKEAVKAFLLSKVLTIEEAKRPEDLVRKAKGLAQIAEVIWILRPLIYGQSFGSSSFRL